jgi:hypothetical protein
MSETDLNMITTSPGVRCVTSFEELVNANFADGVNALCWPRTLPGDFAEVDAQLNPGIGILSLTDDMLNALPLSPEGRIAVEVMLQDYHRLQQHGLQPELNCLNGYLPPPEPPLLRTDVCSWHADSATCPADTWLCTYWGASSEALPNTQAIRHVDMPETRARLLKAYGGADDEAFIEWLADHYYDLHYAALPGAQPLRFGIGNLWRVATLHDGSPVPPCIHRAPDPVSGQKRLLLIS